MNVMSASEGWHKHSAKAESGEACNHQRGCVTDPIDQYASQRNCDDHGPRNQAGHEASVALRQPLRHQQSRTEADDKDIADIEKHLDAAR